MTDENIYNLIAQGLNDRDIYERYLKEAVTRYGYCTSIRKNHDMSPLLKTIEENGFSMLLENVHIDAVDGDFEKSYWKFQKHSMVLKVVIITKRSGRHVFVVELSVEKDNLYKCTWNLDPSELKDHLSVWTDELENRMSRMEDFRHHCVLMQKKYEISQKSIDTLIKTQLNNSGCQYSLRYIDAKTLLKIKLRYGRQIEIISSPFDFQKNLIGLIDTVKKIEELMNSFGSMSVKVTNQNSHEKWCKNG